MPKLTPVQLTVLTHASAGEVYRSERGHDLYACYDRAQGNKRVTAIVDRLSTLGLIAIGEQRIMQRAWNITGEGLLVIKRGGAL
jgi:hypothetical protein